MPLPQEIIRPFSPRARRKWIVSCDYPPRPCSHTERCTRERCSPLNVSTRGTGVVNLQCIATEERNSYQVFDVCYVHLIARVCVRLCVCVCILFSSWQIYSPIWPLNHVWSGFDRRRAYWIQMGGFIVGTWEIALFAKLQKLYCSLMDEMIVADVVKLQVASRVRNFKRLWCDPWGKTIEKWTGLLFYVLFFSLYFFFLRIR